MKLRSHPALMTLTTVIILGALAVLVLVFVLLAGIDSLQQSLHESEAGQTFIESDACLNEALNFLNRDNSYTGGMYTFGDSSCTVLVSGSGDSRTVTLTVSQGAYVSDVSVDVQISTDPISILNWEQVN